jgi:hypothetical protein
VITQNSGLAHVATREQEQSSADTGLVFLRQLALLDFKCFANRSEHPLKLNEVVAGKRNFGGCMMTAPSCFQAGAL